MRFTTGSMRIKRRAELLEIALAAGAIQDDDSAAMAGDATPGASIKGSRAELETAIQETLAADRALRRTLEFGSLWGSITRGKRVELLKRFDPVGLEQERRVAHPNQLLGLPIDGTPSSATRSGAAVVTLDDLDDDAVAALDAAEDFDDDVDDVDDGTPSSTSYLGSVPPPALAPAPTRPATRAAGRSSIMYPQLGSHVISPATSSSAPPRRSGPSTAARPSSSLAGGGGAGELRRRRSFAHTLARKSTQNLREAALATSDTVGGAQRALARPAALCTLVLALELAYILYAITPVFHRRFGPYAFYTLRGRELAALDVPLPDLGALVMRDSTFGAELANWAALNVLIPLVAALLLSGAGGTAEYSASRALTLTVRRAISAEPHDDDDDDDDGDGDVGARRDRLQHGGPLALLARTPLSPPDAFVYSLARVVVAVLRAALSTPSPHVHSVVLTKMLSATGATTPRGAARVVRASTGAWAGSFEMVHGEKVVALVGATSLAAILLYRAVTRL